MESTTRTLLLLLLLLVVGLVTVASVMFSDSSRVFLLKSSAAALLSLIPGWMYLQFVRNKGLSLYDEYVLNLFRLKIDAFANLPAPPQHTTWYPMWKAAHATVVPAHVTDNLYRRKFEAVYGPCSVSTVAQFKNDRPSLRERTETFGPVIMATILIALGWALVLEPELLRTINLLGVDYELSGRPVLPGEALRFSFIGAYAFIVLDLGRRYFRDDLKSSAYLSATTRIVFASALVVAADAAGVGNVLEPTQANAIAFFVGFFPRAGFTWLRSMLPARLQAAIPQLESDYPLRHLEGLNVWYESRLIEEGVESMQNLCSANLVDLMLKTRLPIMRVVDWIDQAFLYLHLPKSPDRPEQPPPGLRQLRVVGIRTATDLERAWTQPERPPELDRMFARALLPDDPGAINALMASLLLTLEGEPNLWHVRAFRRLGWLSDEDRGVSREAVPASVVTTTAPGVLGEASVEGNGHRRRRGWKRNRPGVASTPG